MPFLPPFKGAILWFNGGSGQNLMQYKQTTITRTQLTSASWSSLIDITPPGKPNTVYVPIHCYQVYVHDTASLTLGSTARYTYGAAGPAPFVPSTNVNGLAASSCLQIAQPQVATITTNTAANLPIKIGGPTIFGGGGTNTKLIIHLYYVEIPV